MPKAKQLTVSHENLPGMLAHIAKVLGDAQVNILAFLTTTSGSEGLTHLIVDRLDTAKKAFASAGLAYTETDALQLELPNTPGALGSSPASSLTKTSTSPWATRQAKRASRRSVWYLPFPI